MRHMGRMRVYAAELGPNDVDKDTTAQRVAEAALESACLTVPEIAEAAVAPRADQIKGRMPEVYASLKPGHKPSKRIEEKLANALETTIGKIARPKHVYIVPDLPKTRSGKIMRRVLASISNQMDVGDVTTLATPEVVEEVRKLVQAS